MLEQIRSAPFVRVIVRLLTDRYYHQSLALSPFPPHGPTGASGLHCIFCRQRAHAIRMRTPDPSYRTPQPLAHAMPLRANELGQPLLSPLTHDRPSGSRDGTRPDHNSGQSADDNGEHRPR